MFKGMALAEDKSSWEITREGVWFMFVTCTTIGFGDMTPNFLQVLLVLPYAWPAAGALLRFAWCGLQSAGCWACCLLPAACCIWS